MTSNSFSQQCSDPEILSTKVHTHTHASKQEYTLVHMFCKLFSTEALPEKLSGQAGFDAAAHSHVRFKTACAEKLAKLQKGVRHKKQGNNMLKYCCSLFIVCIVVSPTFSFGEDSTSLGFTLQRYGPSMFTVSRFSQLNEELQGISSAGGRGDVSDFFFYYISRHNLTQMHNLILLDLPECLLPCHIGLQART